MKHGLNKDGKERRTKRRVLPLRPPREERDGERRGVFARISPLPNPLPTRSSRGEGDESLSPLALVQGQCPLPPVRAYSLWWPSVGPDSCRFYLSTEKSPWR